MNEWFTLRDHEGDWWFWCTREGTDSRTWLCGYGSAPGTGWLPAEWDDAAEGQLAHVCALHGILAGGPQGDDVSDVVAFLLGAS